MRNLSQLNLFGDFKARYVIVYPPTDRGVSVNSGQLHTFSKKIVIGDLILTYNEAERKILVGRTLSEYIYDPTLFGAEYPNVRRIEWIQKLPREEFSQEARRTLGGKTTVYSLDNILYEIDALLSGESISAKQTNAYEKARVEAIDLISDRLDTLSPYEYQDLVSAVFRSMGFRTESSPRGKDKGVDVKVYVPSSFGFNDAIYLKIQVKKQKSAASSPDVQRLKGTLNTGEIGIFVSQRGFTLDAEQQAEEGDRKIALFDNEKFINVLLEHYENLEQEFKDKLKLVKLWIPSE